MLVLQTIVHETIWGGKKLTPYSKSTCEKIGHLYSVNCNEEGSNLILNGAYAGKRLNDYFNAVKDRFGLEKYDYFPLIVALVEARDNLSIQVHPDDDAAPVLDSHIKLGKNESWYFIDPPASGFIYDGCLCQDMNELKQSILSGQMERVTGHLPVKKGDYTYVVAGTLHAMTAGSLVYEIEENAGCTYRFFDFDRADKNGRKRPLQISEAYFSIHLKNKSEVTQYHGKAPIEERRYITWHFDNVERYKNDSPTLQVFTVLDGICMVDGIEIAKGMSVLLEPGEELCINQVEAMVAQPKRLS